MKAILDILQWAILYFMVEPFRRAAIARQFRPAERRRLRLRAHWIGDRRGATEPVLTRGLMRTIIICVTLVLATSLGYAALGMVEGLLLVPVFIAYIFFVLFSRSLVLKVREILA